MAGQKLSFLILALLFASPSLQAKIAKVIMVRGEVYVSENGNQVPLKNGIWLEEGDRITTLDKSFVRLQFIDKSTMNVGSQSQIEVKTFNDNSKSLINIIKGKIRATVTKDALARQENKMIIATKTAAMGIRGTEFIVSYNEKENETALLTLKGLVAMAPIEANDNIRSATNLINHLNTKALEIPAGLASRFNPNEKNMDVKKIDPIQRYQLGKAENKNAIDKLADSKGKVREVLLPGTSKQGMVKDAPTVSKIEQEIEKKDSKKIKELEQQIPQPKYKLDENTFHLDLEKNKIEKTEDQRERIRKPFSDRRSKLPGLPPSEDRQGLLCSGNLCNVPDSLTDYAEYREEIEDAALVKILPNSKVKFNIQPRQ